jgi:hypothetical protein
MPQPNHKVFPISGNLEQSEQKEQMAQKEQNEQNEQNEQMVQHGTFRTV